MGIYDREYYRRDGPSFLGSLAGRGQVCKWLILINSVLFVLQLLTRGQNIDVGGFIVPNPDPGPLTNALVLDVSKVFEGQLWRLLTYAFVHDTHTVWHIVFNMLFLWWFGSDVEDIYSSREFLCLYLLSALLGGIAFVLIPMAGVGNAVCLGASGAVTAVMVLCALHYPTRIILLFFFLPVPIWLFVLFQVGQDLFGLLSGNAGGTAVTVHLAGAAFAYVYYKRQWRLLTLWQGLRLWQGQRARPRLRVYHEEASQPVPVSASPPAAAEVDEQLEAKLDAVLEKVARSGQSSLTESEREILFRASEIYKRRRT